MYKAKQRGNLLQHRSNIHDLGVSAKCRKKGVGTDLAMAAIQKAKDDGFAVIALVSVADSDPFWRKMGFQIKDKLSYGNHLKKMDAYKMELEI